MTIPPPGATGDPISDSAIGACCERCGTYFVIAHGVPVICEECWAAETAANLEDESE